MTAFCTLSLPAFSLPWVQVQGDRLVDDQGREVKLRGINARVSGLFDVSFDDGRPPLEHIPEFGLEDVRLMKELGFNFLRLPINWSGLEPNEGEFSQSYLDRIKEVVSYCKQYEIYVLIDFHQDAYSKEIGEDGAPAWAIIPRMSVERTEDGELSSGELEERRRSPQAIIAFTNFFLNRHQIQDRFLPAFTKIVSTFKDESAVIGFEIMNEPMTYQIPFFGNWFLFRFYKKVVAAAREIDKRHTIWIEPDAVQQNIFMNVKPFKERFPDPQIVYAPHFYPVFRNWGKGIWFETESEWIEEFGSDMDDNLVHAESLGAPLVYGEWGLNPKLKRDEPYFRAFRKMTDARSIGHAMWLWKESSQDSWGLFDYGKETGFTLNESAAKLVGTPYASLVPGKLAYHHFDENNGKLEIKFILQEGSGKLDLFVPRRWYSDRYEIRLNDQVLSSDSIQVQGDWVTVTASGSQVLQKLEVYRP